MGVGEGHGKLLLFGEHAAVYGYPAVGIALPLSITATLTPALSWERPPLPAREGGLIDAALTAVSDVLGRQVEPCRLVIESTLPMSRGFGSSAAFSVALIRALEADHTAETAPHIATETLWRRAHALERVFHGTPSGIDTGLAVLGGVQAFRPAPPDLPSAWTVALPDCLLVVGSLPRSLGTAELVGGIRTRLDAGDRRTREAMDALGELCETIARAITERGAGMSVGELGEFALKAQSLLAALGTETPELAAALATLRKHGAEGAKLSGAGGGGAFFGVFADSQRAHEAAAALEAEHRCATYVFSYAERTNLSLEPRLV